MKKRLLFAGMALLAGWFTLTTQAQVNIGTNEEAVSGAILQLRNKKAEKDSVNAYKGVAFPRVELSEVDQLYPMFLFEKPNDPDSGPSEIYGIAKDSVDLVHTGLVVYNLTSNAEEGLFPGLTQWNGSRWVPLAASPTSTSFVGAAVFEDISGCDDVTLNGTYAVGVPADKSHFLTLNLEVKTPGAYTLLAQSDNGYGFYATGVVTEAKRVKLKLPAQGTPTAAGTDKLTFSGIKSSCEQEITVHETASYAVECDKTIVKGSYRKGIDLESTNTLEVTVTVAEPGGWSMTTQEVNGISFSGGGVFETTGTKKVVLRGSGVPDTYNNITLQITYKSNGKTIDCSKTVNIPVMLPEITYAVIGDPKGLRSGFPYHWSSKERHAALRSRDNFGDASNSAVKVEAFTQLWCASTDKAALYLKTDSAGFNGRFPDIVLYNAYGTDANLKSNYLNEKLTRALAAYVKEGGCLIFGAADDDRSADLPNDTTKNIKFSQKMLNLIYGAADAPTLEPQKGSATSTGTGTAYIYGALVDDKDYAIDSLLYNDPIVNGPFGNLAGKKSTNDQKFWGEDNHHSVVAKVPSTTVSVVTICKNTPVNLPAGLGYVTNPDYSIVWYDKNYHLFFFGDVAASETLLATDGNKLDFPAIYSDDGDPLSKLYGYLGATANLREIYNSALELNAVAWAIRQAVTNGGINFK